MNRRSRQAQEIKCLEKHRDTNRNQAAAEINWLGCRSKVTQAAFFFFLQKIMQQL